MQQIPNDIHTYVYTYIYVYTYAHTHTHTHICMYTQTHTRTHIHTHTHTHTHTYVQRGGSERCRPKFGDSRTQRCLLLARDSKILRHPV